MSRKPKHHIPLFAETMQMYANDRGLELHKYSPYHLRLMDGGFVVLDCWTTGRYYILTTDYATMVSDGEIVERGGEKGQLPIHMLKEWLDELFFPEAGNNE